MPGRHEQLEDVLEEPLEDGAGLPATDEVVFRFRQAIIAGEAWFEALLDAVGRWRLPAEDFDGRHFQYLIGGEAFDWLVLAERLLEEVEDLVPVAEREALLFEGHWPMDLDDEVFEQKLGHAKHSAHLNYLYGVLVEEALQLSVEEDIHKEHLNRPWGHDSRDDETMLQRIYGYSREALYAKYYEESRVLLGERVGYEDWKAFTYWLFKLRMKRQDKARVASDTRKGLLQLSRMETAVSERRRGTRLDEAGFAQRFGS